MIPYLVNSFTAQTVNDNFKIDNAFLNILLSKDVNDLETIVAISNR